MALIDPDRSKASNRRHSLAGQSDSLAGDSKRVEVLGVPIDTGFDRDSVLEIIDRKLKGAELNLITFVNPASVALAEREPSFIGVLNKFHIILPDGTGMVHATKLLHGVQVARVSFDSTSLALPLFRFAQKGKYSVALVGGLPGVAEGAATQINCICPDLRVVATFAGFGDLSGTIEELCALAPDIVVCGMGALAQETFLVALAERGWSGCGLTCGGYLDQLAEGVQYYPHWVDELDLRFVYRLIREPRRLWRRYLLEYPTFCGRLARRAVGHRVMVSPRKIGR